MGTGSTSSLVIQGSSKLNGFITGTGGAMAFFLALAEKASHIASSFPRHKVSWKPDLLIPVENPGLWQDSLIFIKDIVIPSGSIFAFSVRNSDDKEVDSELKEVLLLV
jgi:hypothetical protein